MSPNFQRDATICQYWKKTGDSSRPLSLCLLLLQNNYLTDRWNHLNNERSLLLQTYNFQLSLLDRLGKNCLGVVGTGITLERWICLPLIFKHLFWTQWLQLWQKIELMPTPLWQILHSHFTGFDSTDKLCLLHASFVLWTLTRSPFASILSFQIMSFFFKSSKVSAINTRSSA